MEIPPLFWHAELGLQIVMLPRVVVKSVAEREVVVGPFRDQSLIDRGLAGALTADYEPTFMSPRGEIRGVALEALAEERILVSVDRAETFDVVELSHAGEHNVDHGYRVPELRVPE